MLTSITGVSDPLGVRYVGVRCERQGDLMLDWAFLYADPLVCQRALDRETSCVQPNSWEADHPFVGIATVEITVKSIEEYKEAKP